VKKIAQNVAQTGFVKIITLLLPDAFVKKM
jgi:hypothetical protein